MKRIFLLSMGLGFAACQPAATGPQTFEDLLRVTDETDQAICTLPLADVRTKLSAQDLDARAAKAFDFDEVMTTYADNPSAQIRTIFRRAALKRRMNVEGDNTALADEFYAQLDDGIKGAVTLSQFGDKLHYWSERLNEQSVFEDPNSPEFNLRFCVLNENRAVVHAASRADIMARVQAGVILPNEELIENINHETYYADSFRAEMFGKIYTSEVMSKISPLDIGKMRGRNAILPFDPKQAAPFWVARDAEIEAMLKYIENHKFKMPAKKLAKMTVLDQSLRKLWRPESQTHFENAEELEAFKQGVSERTIKVDDFNTVQLQNMLEGRGWFRDDIDGAGAGADAWLIAQHADRNPDFQIKALEMIEAELGAPGVSKSNYAYLYDRVQMRWVDGDNMDERVQRYATQGRCSGPGTWEPFPVEEPDRIDEVRAEVGLGTLAEYKSMFKDMCQEDQR